MTYYQTIFIFDTDFIIFIIHEIIIQHPPEKRRHLKGGLGGRAKFERKKKPIKRVSQNNKAKRGKGHQ